MQYLGFGIFAAVLIGAAWLFARSMTSKERNESDRHGGGVDGVRGDVDPYATATPDIP